MPRRTSVVLSTSSTTSGSAPVPTSRRMQEQYLVGLHDALPLAARIAYQEVRMPHRLDRRTPRHRAIRRENRQPLGLSSEAAQPQGLTQGGVKG